MRRSSDLKDLSILLRQGLVDASDVVVGQMLHFLLQLALLVLRDFGVFLAPPEQFDTVAADIPHRYARLLGIFRRHPRQFAPPLLVQIRDRDPDDLTLGLRVET